MMNAHTRSKSTDYFSTLQLPHGSISSDISSNEMFNALLLEVVRCSSGAGLFSTSKFLNALHVATRGRMDLTLF